MFDPRSDPVKIFRSSLRSVVERTYVRMSTVYIRYSMSRYYVSTMFYILLAMLTPLHRGEHHAASIGR
jgi:hypothetical protein